MERAKEDVKLDGKGGVRLTPQRQPIPPASFPL